MTTPQKAGKKFEKKVLRELRNAGFKKLDAKAWRAEKTKHDRCFAKQFKSGESLYGKRRVDFRVKNGSNEFDVEVKWQNGSGTADVIAWVALLLADMNKVPLYLVIGGTRLLTKCRPVLDDQAESSSHVLGVGTLDEFAEYLVSAD